MTATNKRYPFHSLGGSTHNDIIRKRALRSRSAPDHCVPCTHYSLLPFAPQTTPRRNSVNILASKNHAFSLTWIVLLHSDFQPRLGLWEVYLRFFLPPYCVHIPTSDNECDLCRHFTTPFGRTFRSGLCSSPCQSRQGEER